MNELQVIINQEPGKIEFNFEELKKALAERMALYKGAVFSDEYKAMAKGEVAALRKLYKSIDDRRKLVKKQWNEPYEEFEAKTKELLALVNEPIVLIDNQIKEMEKRRKAERRDEIKKIFEEASADLGGFVPLDKIYDPRWENASTTIASIKKSINELLVSVRTAVATLQAMTSDAVPEAIRRYQDSLDLAGALGYINQYEAQKAEIMRREEIRKREEEERRRQQEEERIRRQERERIAEEERIRREEREKAEAAATREEREDDESGFVVEDALDTLPFSQPDTITAFYKVVATAEELEQVETAFNSIGIFFERRDA